jgi:D-cysteine desulfhydrase
VNGVRDEPLRAIPRLRLAHLPTPLLRLPRLAERLGLDLWIKRDDASGGVEAGNKARKLEFLLAAALAERADTVLTCGGLQSNHCRATAALAARLGLRCIVYLRTDDPHGPLPASGNVLLMRMLGAEIRQITPAEYGQRVPLLAEAARRLGQAGRRAYVIPEGGSNGLGSLGYVEAMRELRTQLDAGLGGGRPFDLVVHACGSGGTAAGLALGAARYGVAGEVRAMAVCDSQAYFEDIAAQIFVEARELLPTLGAPARLVVDDRWKGPRYGVSSPAQLATIAELARGFGLVLDPVYTGKAFAGLMSAVAADPSLIGKRVLFLHTGGLPGLLSQGDELESVL